MKIKLIKIFPVFLILSYMVSSCSPKNTPESKEQLVLIETSLGNIKVKLYNETPLHRDNFIKLINDSFYDNLLFHRTINEFMIQGGDPDSRNAKAGQALGDGGPDYIIKAEFNSQYFHKKGALAAARMGNQLNPEKNSSASQFYIVHGKTFTDEELDKVEQRINDMLKQAVFFGFIKEEKEKVIQRGEESDMAIIQQQASIRSAEKFDSIKAYVIPDYQREIYKTLGGTPHLDQNYTVFGEVVEGLEVVDKIASVETDSRDRPIKDVKIISIKLIEK